MHKIGHTALFEAQRSWPDKVLRTAYSNVSDKCLRQSFRTAYQTQAKPYDLLELMPAQY